MSETLIEQEVKQKKPIHRFKPGESGNPAGRPKGTRNKLQGDFFRRLSDDFQRFGIYAIARARRDDPLGYVKVVAGLMPKEFEILRPLEDVSDEQLDAAYVAVRAILAAQDPGNGEAAAGTSQPTEDVPALSQAD